ncbi:group III truncated hemoglobin [Tritonibacter horizontis]|uniref:Group 3 hemoglobin ctb n=1 Tax=Tritonibacter horizontis TaxID=1768241 RepID=A0A132BVL1_9RHOB|nr:group III truncated hemoglobin [Tritonibacter horizontis]KUP92403.1 group 3 hemoglobin ctb [Tritonibacter horizontis]
MDARPLALFQISPDDINRVVRLFYAEIRKHPILAPVFAAHVENWPEHEEKIASFWRNAILRERVYSGNPMRVHASTPEIKAEHFSDWLDLFHAVLARTVTPQQAQAWGALADRIGEGFRTGVVSLRQPRGAPPRLV